MAHASQRHMASSPATLERMLVSAARAHSRLTLQRLWGFSDKVWEDCEKLRAGAISSGLFLNKALIRKILQRSSNAQVLHELSPTLSLQEEWQDVCVPDETGADDSISYEMDWLEHCVITKIRALSATEKHLVYRMIKNL